MKKILFDSSVHLGQFDIRNELKRVWCKNSQISISDKNGIDSVKGYYTFNENGWMDKIIWGLDRLTQDTFYPFMDMFYSVKDIDGVPFDSNCLNIFNDLKLKFYNIDDSNLLSASVAIENGMDEIHSAYEAFQNTELVSYISTKGVKVLCPTIKSFKEKTFSEEGNLENLYQDAYSHFQKVGCNPPEKNHG